MRELADKADTVGIVIVSILAPVLLWDFIPPLRLVLWGITLAVVAAVTISTAPPSGPGVIRWVLRHSWNLASAALWAMLPWLSPTAIQNPEVAWIMAIVVVYGVATDIVFVPQTLEIRLFNLIYAYSASYLVALALMGQWGPAIAVFGSVVALVHGGVVWQRAAERLVEQRDASDRRARSDELTGLASRDAATSRVEEMLESAAPGAILHCVFADIDDFKILNDTYGYEFGDEVLRAVALHLQTQLPDDWMVARFGGDEFVAVGRTAADLSRLLDLTFQLPTELGGVEVEHRLSVGCSSLPAVQASSAVLFREAASALREAKKLGKHRAFVMSDEARAAADARSRLGSRLGNALESGEIIAWVQPIVELRTGQYAGYELLARWPQPDGTMVMPNDFVPLIEDQGRGPQLGMTMIANGIAVLARLNELGETSSWVSVNLSARHLFHQRLPHEIRAMLETARITPSRLVLEITESQHLPSSPVWKQTAEQLRGLGVGLAIDDFGTGYSSMEQLLSMPFSHLKVDRVVTRSIDLPGAFDLAAAMAAMAHGADMMPVVEGIETERERTAMMRAGFLHGQGYLFARPQPIEELLASRAGVACADNLPA